MWPITTIIFFGKIAVYLSFLGDSDESISNEHPELRAERLELHHLPPVLLGVVDGSHRSIVEPRYVNDLIPFFLELLLVGQDPVVDAMGLSTEKERGRGRGERKRERGKERKGEGVQNKRIHHERTHLNLLSSCAL